MAALTDFQIATKEFKNGPEPQFMALSVEAISYYKADFVIFSSYFAGCWNPTAMVASA